MTLTDSQQKTTGKGRISFIDDKAVGCECVFTFVQRAEGTIVVECELGPEDFQNLQTEVSKRPEGQGAFWFGNSLHKFLTFNGETESGFYLEISDVYYIATSNSPRLKLIFYTNQATLKNVLFGEASYWVFGLANYEMIDVQEREVILQNGIKLNGNLAQLHFNDKSAYLRAVEDHSKLIDKLKADGGVAVTAEFILPVTNVSTIEDARKVATSLCYVLTFLSGNSVDWFSCALVDSEGHNAAVYHKYAITRPFQTTDLLQTLSQDRVGSYVRHIGYEPIINRMMERFESESEKWNLVNVINTWHEAMLLRPLWETNGLLLSICMEMLKHSYLHHGGREYIMRKQAFNKKSKELKGIVRDLLKTHFPFDESLSQNEHEHEEKLDLMSAHIQEFNRYSFNHVIHAMANELNLFPQWVTRELSETPHFRGFTPSLTQFVPNAAEIEKSADEQAQKELSASIKAFVDIRNKLTHQGCFIGGIENNEWAREEQPKQLWFMQRFVGAFLSTILGWHQPLPPPPDSVRNPPKSLS